MNNDFEKVFKTAARISDLYASIPDYSALMDSIRSAVDMANSVNAVAEALKHSETIQQAIRSAADMEQMRVSCLGSMEAVQSVLDSVRIPILESIRQVNSVIDNDMIYRIRSAVDSIRFENEGVILPEELVPDEIVPEEDASETSIERSSGKLIKLPSWFARTIITAFIGGLFTQPVLDKLLPSPADHAAIALVEAGVFVEMPDRSYTLSPVLRKLLDDASLPEGLSGQPDTQDEQFQFPEQHQKDKAATTSDFEAD